MSLETRIRTELARLEQELPALVRERNNLNDTILRYEGAILGLRGVLTEDDTAHGIEDDNAGTDPLPEG